MLITLLQGDFGTYELLPVNRKIQKRVEREVGEETILFQTDWDYPSPARSLGWNGKVGREHCQHKGTDGTVDCLDCGRTASDFIGAAQTWLDNHCGQTFRGKGEEYFDNY